MSRQIDNLDRIINKYVPSDPDDKSLQNANNVMTICDKIIDGGYRSRPNRGTTAERPVSPDDYEFRINTDFHGFEIYIPSTGWLVLFGYWSLSNRPTTENLVSGSSGFNIDLSSKEHWDGTNWVIG